MPMLEVLGAVGAANRGVPRIALASALADGAGCSAGAPVTLPPAHASYDDALRASRELLRTCKPGGPIPVLLEGAVGTAIVINELPAARAAAVWTAVQQGAVLSLARSEAAPLGRPVRSRRRARCSGDVRARHACRRIGAERRSRATTR